MMVFLVVQVQAHADSCQCRTSCFLQVSSVNFFISSKGLSQFRASLCSHIPKEPKFCCYSFLSLPLQHHTALTLFFAFYTSSVETIHSNWRQLSFLCLPFNIFRGRYRFGAGLETITDVFPGPYLEDCSKFYCIWFR